MTLKRILLCLLVACVWAGSSVGAFIWGDQTGHMRGDSEGFQRGVQQFGFLVAQTCVKGEILFNFQGQSYWCGPASNRLSVGGGW